jgi:spore germination cell wall hydrolase CwlJ-like protein
MATRARRRSNKTSRAERRARVERLVLSSFAVVLGGAWLVARWQQPAPPPPPPPHRLSAEEARAVNAATPFADDHPHAARPFHFHGTEAAEEQAVQCLATAAIYEAGSDARGREAVMQVVLNRLALPQFPKTVCGVVYQGASRVTGCQFSFSCDGSQARRPEHEGWEAARAEARQALHGAVFAPVGTATHYHTDWIVPYWKGSLDKIAQVHSHIFYRPHLRVSVPAQ